MFQDFLKISKSIACLSTIRNKLEQSLLLKCRFGEWRGRQETEEKDLVGVPPPPLLLWQSNWNVLKEKVFLRFLFQM